MMRKIIALALSKPKPNGQPTAAARPSLLTGLLGLGLIAAGITVVSRYQQTQSEQIKAGAAELAYLRTNLLVAAQAARQAARRADEHQADDPGEAPPYPSAEDLNPLRTTADLA